MKVVIDMPDEAYKTLLEEQRIPTGLDLEYLVMHGTPLPKGHGRLIDADETIKAMNTWDKFGYTETGCFVRNPGNDYVPYVHYEDMVKSVSDAPTIIDKEGKDDRQ